jgi:hypothetical protein
MGNARGDTLLAGEAPEPRPDAPSIAADDAAAAMGEDRVAHTFGGALSQLRENRPMTDAPAVPLPHDREPVWRRRRCKG